MPLMLFDFRAFIMLSTLVNTGKTILGIREGLFDIKG